MKDHDPDPPVPRDGRSLEAPGRIDAPPALDGDDEPSARPGLGAIGQLVAGLLTVAGLIALVVVTLVVLRWVFT